MANPQFAHQRVRIDPVETDMGHGLNRGLAQLLAIDPSRLAGQIVEKQVFRDRQGRQQIELLHDHANTQLLRLGPTGGTVIASLELHLASGRLDQPTDDFRQRAFTGTVLTGQRQHFAAHQRQINAGQHRLRIRLADTADRKDCARGTC
ncbi:hypothetical protein D3C80_1736160 [compost metagenome]